MKYIIDEELRDSLIGLIILIQKASSNDKLFLSDGRIFKVPYLSEIKNDLYELNRFDDEK